MEFGLSLGSNLGDRLEHLKRAKEKISAIPGVEIIALSAVYETGPVDVPQEFQDKKFLNAAMVIKSDLDPVELSAGLHAIEDGMGRLRRNDRNRPRRIDIDMIYADRTGFHSTELDLPHPNWAKRRFVVQPLADVRPELTLPGETRSVRQVLLSLPETPEVVMYARDW